MVGYDGEMLAFVEVKTRTSREEMSALPELRHTGQDSIFWRARLGTSLRSAVCAECPCRFDVVAIDNRPGKPPGSPPA